MILRALSALTYIPAILTPIGRVSYALDSTHTDVAPNVPVSDIIASLPKYQNLKA